MKRYVETIKRRTFFKKGLAGGMIFVVQSLGKIFSISPPLTGSFPKSSDQHQSLLEIVHKYGGEFGEIKEDENGCL